MDEEPPRGPDREALEVALQIGYLLNAKPVDEVHFMRKIVIDGSNVSGFQRTAIVAVNGKVDTPGGALESQQSALRRMPAVSSRGRRRR